ncbi:MAG TPA: c-type cytochrome domain-containing protein [Planctomycetota bacterium]|jgi:mono/diheme cytochrome c family protein|nr:c-type cytochrome domain-containing protein [Planctomycetota bacterium]
MRCAAAVVVALGLLAAGSSAAPAQDKKKPDAAAASFAKDVMPILKASCIKCHDSKNKKGGLDVSTYDSLKKGGKGGAGVTPGDPDKSSVVTAISGDKPDMPKKADPLKKDQVDLIARWIKEGAKNN